MTDERGADLAAPVHDVERPGGKPASWMTSANMLAQSGACSDGFQTTVQPTASP